MEVVVKDTYDQMSQAAGALVRQVLNAKPDAVLGLATGSTPLGLYKEMARLHREEGLDFQHVTTFNLDEYVGLPPTHPQSYRTFMNENLFDHINILKENTYVPSGTTDNYEAFCEWYETRIEECGGVDLQVLGIGSDGHIGFNEPASSLASRTRLKTLAESTINDNARFFEKRQDVPIYAITMGVGTILEADQILLVANGENKAEVVAGMIEGPVTSMNTASALQMHPRVTVFLDRPAASKLKMLDYYLWVQDKKPAAPH